MQTNQNGIKRVCFFDSGIGGLSLFYKCRQKLGNAKLYYYADNFNVPYGNLSQAQITEKVDEIFSEISKRSPAAAVVACNTVTATCVGYLREKYNFPIIGIQPAVKPAAAVGSCTVLATKATANSAALGELVAKFGNGRTIVTACTNLAAYVENNIFNINEEEVLKLLPYVTTDAIVLGCTHYAFIKDIIAKKYARPVYDGLDGTAARLCRVLGLDGNLPVQTQAVSEVYFVGGDAKKNENVFKLLCVGQGGGSKR